MENLPMLSCIFPMLVFFVGVVDGASGGGAAPSASMDCSDSLLNLANCLTFVQNGSAVSKPDGSCCSGLKSIMKDKAACVCDAFKNSNSYGVSLNMTRAMSLPSLCGLSSNALSQCGITGVPGEAPSHAPKHSHHSLPPTADTTPSPAAATTPGSIAGSLGGIVAPVPAPAQSGNRESDTALPILSIVLASVAVAMALHL